MSAEPVEPVDDTPWMQLEFNHDAKCFVFSCSCEWSGRTQNLHRAAAGIGEHLKACDGTRPNKIARHYVPENFREARVESLPKYTAGQDN